MPILFLGCYRRRNLYLYQTVIKRETIDKIVDTAQIEEVVGDFVNLKKRGANLLGLCPFHNEKTPSFTVSPSKGIYKCFGCGEAGNSVNFIMTHEHYSYPEALRYLANKYNIEIEETEAPTQEDLLQQNERESLYIVNSYAQRYYTDQLLNTEAGQSIGLSYFKERGFSKDTIEKFQLGYAPGGFDTFTQQALKEGYQKDILVKSGLTSEKNDKLFDFFRERVQFTIHNFSGKVVGFGGRTLKTDKKIPKYINTPETEIYNKSKILYGLFFSKNAMRREDECILVEGYTDVISLHQAGIENVVASSGTSLTVEQVKLIKRLTPNITIIYDGDPAGIKAALRGIDLILEEDMNVRVVALPESEDPDSYVKSVGASEFLKYKDSHSHDFIIFKANLLLEDAGNDPVKRSGVIKDIVESIALVPDAIKRTLYIQECSKLLDIGEQLLVTETNKLRRKKLTKEAGRPTEETRPQDDAEAPEAEEQRDFADIISQTIRRQERDIIRLLLSYGALEFEEEVLVAQAILHDLEADGMEFSDELSNRVLGMYREQLEQGEVPTEQYFLGHEDKEISGLAIELLHSPYEVSPNWEKLHEIVITDVKFLYKKDIRTSLWRYKLEKIAGLLKDNRDAIAQIKPETEEAEQELMDLLEVRSHLLELRKQVSALLGTVVLR